jgi:hypothetical protein
MRGSLIVIVGACVLTALSIVVARPPESLREPATRAPAADRTTITLDTDRATDNPHDRKLRRIVVRRAPQTAVASAHRFVAAYLRWKAGNASPAEVRALRQTSTSRLWRKLDSGRELPAAKDLALALRRSGRRWLVSSLDR